jgi:hypothetical protein
LERPQTSFTMPLEKRQIRLLSCSAFPLDFTARHVD